MGFAGQLDEQTTFVVKDGETYELEKLVMDEKRTPLSDEVEGANYVYHDWLPPHCHPRCRPSSSLQPPPSSAQ